MKLFHDPTTVLPKGNSDVVGINQSQMDMAGRHDHVPAPDPANGAATGLHHVGEQRPAPQRLGHYRRAEFREKWGK